MNKHGGSMILDSLAIGGMLGSVLGGWRDASLWMLLIASIFVAGAYWARTRPAGIPVRPLDFPVALAGCFILYGIGKGAALLFKG
jgi:hypothetical protein